MTKVVLRNVSLKRGSTEILRNVNFVVEPGEFCVFVGPSGCGKSTLLRLIAGLDADADGEFEIDGVAMTNVPAAKRNVAMVFQGYALYPHMTVYDNMAFALRRNGVSKEDVVSRVTEAARILKLAELLQRKPGQLSGGQRQRVAIGRAIVKKPKVFLFDEPLSNLDASLRVETRVEIAKLHRDMGSASMLYVTHDQIEALTLADKIVLLRPLAQSGSEGSVVQIGRPMDLYHHPANLFAARFIGTPGMNLIEAKVTATDAQGLEIELLGLRYRADTSAAGVSVGEMVTVGIRPEHVDCGPTGRLQAQVTHVEALGEYSVLYLKLAGVPAPILAKSLNTNVAVGDSMPLHLPSHALHVFRADGQAQTRMRAVP